MLRIANLKPLVVTIGVSLSVCVGCGSNSDAGSGSPGGSGGSVTASSAGNLGGAGGPVVGNSGGGSGGTSSSGGAPSGNPGNYSSGIAGDRLLGSLTDDEFAGLCKKLSDYFSFSTPTGKNLELTSCRFTSAVAALFTAEQTDAALRTACQSSYDKCIASGTTATETCTKPPATCAATVAEYDLCLNDQVQALNQIESAVPSCDKLTVASLTALFLSLGGMTAACQTVEDKCPSAPEPHLFEDTPSEPNP